jgi:hypothetical protein
MTRIRPYVQRPAWSRDSHKIALAQLSRPVAVVSTSGGDRSFLGVDATAVAWQGTDLLMVAGGIHA